MLGCSDSGAGDEAAATCAWGGCDVAGVFCVATGVADGSWLTVDWDDVRPEGDATPRALRLPSTPGYYVAGAVPIGEVRCQGLRPGAATVRVRARVRMFTTDLLVDGDHDCPTNWNVSLRLRVDGSADRTLSGMATDVVNDPGCRRGPNLTEDVSVFVGDDGRLGARVYLDQCDRPYPGNCVFLRGTGVEVTQ